MKVSVVIPTRNRKESLQRCVGAIQNGTRKPDEIIIVNDASSDDTRIYLEKTKNTIIKPLHSDVRLGKSNARNTGIKKSYGEIIAFIDDDCVPSSSWLNELVRPFENNDIHFSIGKTVYVHSGHVAHFPERIIQNTKAFWPMTCNIAYRASAFKEIGYFDKKMDWYNFEDAEFAIRALSKGMSFARCTTAVVHHEKQIWKPLALLHSARSGAAFSILAKKYPEHYKKFHPPIFFNIISPHEYILIILFPIIFIPAFFLYLYRGNKNIVLFFTKWPVFMIYKRILILHSAFRYRQLLV